MSKSFSPSYLFLVKQMTTRTHQQWLRPLWECIGNNFIAKIQVPSLPEQHHYPVTDTLHTPNHRPTYPLISFNVAHFHLSSYILFTFTTSVLLYVSLASWNKMQKFTSSIEKNRIFRVFHWVVRSTCLLVEWGKVDLHSGLMRYNWLHSPTSKKKIKRKKKRKINN